MLCQEGQYNCGALSVGRLSNAHVFELAVNLQCSGCKTRLPSQVERAGGSSLISLQDRPTGRHVTSGAGRPQRGVVPHHLSLLWKSVGCLTLH